MLISCKISEQVNIESTKHSITVIPLSPQVYRCQSNYDGGITFRVFHQDFNFQGEYFCACLSMRSTKILQHPQNLAAI